MVTAKAKSKSKAGAKVSKVGKVAKPASSKLAKKKVSGKSAPVAAKKTPPKAVPKTTAKAASKVATKVATKIATKGKVAPKAKAVRKVKVATPPIPKRAQKVAAKIAANPVTKAPAKPAKTAPSPEINYHLLAKPSTVKIGGGLSEAEVIKQARTDYMSRPQLNFFKQRLLSLQTELRDNAGATTEHLRELAVAPDPADRATLEEEHALELRTRDRERKLLKKVQSALLRIEDGSYGYCEETGEPIGLKRLDARPTATLSIEAQERHEKRERVYRDE